MNRENGSLHSLDWLVDEIEASLKQAYESLDAYLKDPSDEPQIRFCQSSIHQVHGTLKITECHGAILLAEEMEELVSGLLENRISNVTEASEVLVQASLKLPQYIRQVSSSGSDQPATLISLINDLRAVRGKPLLSEGSLFSPHMDISDIGTGGNSSTLPNNDAFVELVKKLRQMYQVALLGLIRGADRDKNLGYINRVFSRLSELSKGTAQYQLWRVALAVQEGISHHSIPTSSAVTSLLRGLDREIRQLQQHGVSSLEREVPQGLLKNLLYYVAFSNASTDRILEVTEAFRLREALPAGSFGGEGSLTPSFDADAVRAIATALLEEVNNAKEMVTRYQLEGGLDGSMIGQLCEIFTRMSDSLAFVGQTRLSEPLDELQQRMQEVSDRSDTMNVVLLGDIANHLVDIESALVAWGSSGGQIESAENQANMELHRAREALLRETRNGLEKVKDSIVEYISSQWDKHFLEHAPQLLTEVRGALEMMSLERPAKVLDKSCRYIQEKLLSDASIPDWRTLDSLADAITSIEYYLDGCVGVSGEETPDAISILTMAENSAALLHGEEPVAEATEELTLLDDSSQLLGEEPESAAGDVNEVLVAQAAEQAAQETDSDIDEEIIEIFVEEAGEVLDMLREQLPNWQANPTTGDELGDIRRGFHTLKGSGRMVEAMRVGELAWSVEYMLNRVIDNLIPLSSDIPVLVGQAVKLLPTMVSNFEQRQEEDNSAEIDQLIANANAVAHCQAVDLSSIDSADNEDALPIDDEVEVLAATDATEVDAATTDDSETEELDLVDNSPAEDESGELLSIFVNETRRHLEDVSLFLTEIQQLAPHYGLPTPGLLRALHTLKGSALMAEVAPVSQLMEPLEGLVKDLYNFQQAVDWPLVQLLTDSVTVLQNALPVLESGDQHSAIEGSDELLVRIDESRQRLLPMVASEQPEDDVDDDSFADALAEHESVESLVDETEEPSISEQAQQEFAEHLRPLIALMTDGLDQLMDAETLFANWRDSGEQPSLDTLVEEYDQLGHAAAKAEEPALAQLAAKVADTLQVVDMSAVADPQAVVTTLAGAHDKLLVMIDALAAGQQMPEADEEVTSLELLASDLHHQAAQSEVDAADDTVKEEVVQEETVHEETAQEDASQESVEQDDDTELPIEAVAEDVAELMDQQEEPHDQLEDVEDAEPTEVLEDEQTDELESAEQSDSETTQADEATGQEPEPAHSELVAEAPLAFIPPVAVTDSSDEDQFDLEVLAIFMEETGELLETIDNSVYSWREEPHISTWPDEIKRALHTFKGGARMAAQDELGDLSHNFESWLIESEHRAGGDDGFFDELQQRLDQLHAGVRQLAVSVSGSQVAQSDTAENAAPVAADLGKVPLPQLLADSDIKAPEEMVKVSATLLDNLVNMAGETSISRGRVEQQISSFGFALEEMNTTIRRLQDQVRRLGIETEAQIIFRREQIESAGSDEEFDPLEMDRYSKLQQLSRSLMESASDLQDLKTTLGQNAKETENLLVQQGRINTDLQEGLMRSRMVPFSRLVPRLRRIVRQVSAELDKQVELQLLNVEGEMDRSVLEKMLPALDHMLRNAIDHGIESGEDRSGVGKSERGTISIDLAREGGDIIIKLADDGRGLNIDAIRKQAIKQGLMAHESNLSDHEVVQFILEPGFSTSETVSHISGRGVGLDVVNAEVRQLGGAIAIRSQQGQGTEFQVRLPFTVSINRALMIEIGDDSYALPLTSIDGVVRLSPQQLENFYSNPQLRYEYGGSEYSVRHLGSLLQEGAAPRISAEEQAIPLVLVRSEQQCYAVQVDRLVGSSEIVVKTLGAQFSTVPGLSGATVLGDGRVVVILDLLALLRTQKSSALAKVQWVEDAEAAAARSSVPMVMVVDDSVTVRKVTSRFLEREGFQVLTAKDGADAMLLLREHDPDVMLLDIEMPRMDGFEVASRVRSMGRFKNLPIIMITSRTGDKHRERALSLGVNHYLGKPYREEDLRDAIDELLTAEVE
ncbi:Hpt domain-containing protein [Porticoccus sp. W117]|uniref:hybrid sensor histidine kinase/response regulator n=1 Tax=Porticoccus sp. W117 TaxID=3054777 RepID=UPI0025958721|nr:Hpt domain-containing protein [Porticoccus sp. W117]MDM3872058.1 Hpt domain-containing protein [Porticoccus sp. W117]